MPHRNATFLDFALWLGVEACLCQQYRAQTIGRPRVAPSRLCACGWGTARHFRLLSWPVVIHTSISINGPATPRAPEIAAVFTSTPAASANDLNVLAITNLFPNACEPQKGLFN